VELVHQAAGFEHLQGAIDGHAVNLGILLFGELKKPFGVEMLAGLVDKVQQNLPLAREAEALLLERALDGRLGHTSSLVHGEAGGYFTSFQLSAVSCQPQHLRSGALPAAAARLLPRLAES